MCKAQSYKNIILTIKPSRYDSSCQGKASRAHT